MIAGLSGLFSLVGTVFSVVGSIKQAKAQERAEEVRKNQMKMEAMRARREQVRRAQVARSQAVAAATNQGALTTSALAGGTAQIRNEATRNVVAINQDEEFGKQLFQANRDFARGGMISALGSGIASLGSAFSSSSGTITRLGYA